MRDGDSSSHRAKWTRRRWLAWTGTFVAVGCQPSHQGNAPSPRPRASPPSARVPSATVSSATVSSATVSSATVSSATVSSATAPPSPSPTTIPEDATLVLQPLGELPEIDLDFVQQALGAFYAYEFRVQPRLALPASTYYAPRKRYRAEKLLDLLDEHKPEGARFILGLTAVDISTTKGDVFDWGILGLASVAGTACIISSFRARREAKSATHQRERLAKTAVHEIGHNLGLPHCPNVGCLMEDGKGSVFTTDGEYDLCETCRARLVNNGARLAPRGLIPWPRPS